MKICTKCKKSQEESNFYKNRTNIDGLAVHCKECREAYKKKYRQENKEKISKYFKEYNKHKGYNTIKKTPQQIEKRKEYIKRYKSKNPEKIKAHKTVECALKAGRLTKKPCVICGDKNTEAHHDDYSKHLDVVWLCRKHHSGLHWKDK